MRKGEMEMVPERERRDGLGGSPEEDQKKSSARKEGHEDEGGKELHDGPDLRQDGWVQNNCDGCGAERQESVT